MKIIKVVRVGTQLKMELVFPWELEIQYNGTNHNMNILFDFQNNSGNAL